MEKVSVFLGGTCEDSTWRSELIPQLSENIEWFNPQLPPGAWNPEAQKVEDFHRENDDICLYVITPEGKGWYSFIEATDDSNKRPTRTILCVLMEVKGKKFEGHIEKCVLKTIKVVAQNGAMVFDNLADVVTYLNSIKIVHKTKTK